MRLVFLSDTFYSKYGELKEILTKSTRPYVCLELKIGNNSFAVPFRHHITHKYAFITYGNCGLDYTKAVVILDESFISSCTPQINQKEFDAIKGKEARIHNGLRRYIKLYKEALLYRTNPHYRNILQYSSLKHFAEHI